MNLLAAQTQLGFNYLLKVTLVCFVVREAYKSCDIGVML